jgi:hypothetical protein
MRLWPDLLFANGREVSGHVVSIADGRLEPRVTVRVESA